MNDQMHEADKISKCDVVFTFKRYNNLTFIISTCTCFNGIKISVFNSAIVRYCESNCIECIIISGCSVLYCAPEKKFTYV
jgi:hypothetical protein